MDKTCLVLDSRKTKHVNFYICYTNHNECIQLVTTKDYNWKTGSVVEVYDVEVKAAKLKDPRLTVRTKEFHLVDSLLISEPSAEHVHHELFSKLAIQIAKSKMIGEVHRFFTSTNAPVPIVTPKLLLAKSEGGSEVFEVDYYGDKAYLAQSPQLYKQMLASTIFPNGVYEVGAAYRAEKSNSSQHLSEFTSIDVEMSVTQNGLNDIIGLAIDLIGYLLEEPLIIKTIDLLDLGLDDITKQQEQDFCKDFNGLVVVKHFNPSVRAFYTDGYNNFDILYKGVEIVSGSLRENVYDNYIKKLEYRNMSTEGLEEYLKVFKEGCFKTGGFAIGLERLLMLKLGLSSIKQTLI